MVGCHQQIHLIRTMAWQFQKEEDPVLFFPCANLTIKSAETRYLPRRLAATASAPLTSNHRVPNTLWWRRKRRTHAKRVFFLIWITTDSWATSACPGMGNTRGPLVQPLGVTGSTRQRWVCAGLNQLSPLAYMRRGGWNWHRYSGNVSCSLIFCGRIWSKGW